MRKLEVPNWIIENQFARRNLTREQKSYLIGQRYQNEKNSRGGDHKSKAQNEPLINTAEKVAAQSGVSRETVKRDAEFAKGVDAIGDASPELKADILSGKSGLTKSEVTEAIRQNDALANMATNTPKRLTVKMTDCQPQFFFKCKVMRS